MTCRRLAMVLVLVVSLLALLGLSSSPSGINISGEGVISLETRVALAAHIESQDIDYTTAVPGSEIVEARNRNSKTHWLGGDSYSWDGTIGSIHYEDNGWQEIDNAFESALAPWDWQMLKAGYHIRVKEDFTAGQIIEFEKQGETVQFQPMALEWTNDLDQIQPISMPANVIPAITNPEVDLLPAVGMLSHQGTIRWDDAYGEGLDFEWKCSSTRLLKRLEIESLNKLSAPEQYILGGGNPVLRLNLIFAPSSNMDIYVDSELWDKKAKKQTFDVIEFRKDGDVFWGFMPLRYWDSGEDNEGQSIATLEKRGNSLYISVRVPYAWLQSAVYPVFIDTDVDEDITLTKYDATESGIVFWSTSDTYIQSYNDIEDHIYRCTGYNFPTVAIPQGSTIGVAYMTSWTISDDDPYLDIHCHDVDSSNDFVADATLLSRARTEASAEWDAQNIGTNAYKNTPSLVSPTQEVINRDLWVTGNGLTYLFIAKTDIDNRFLRLDACEDHTISLHIEYSAGATEADISNLPASKSFGNVDNNSSYWSDGSAPTWPLDDSECFFTITNNGDACSITIEATNFTGGVGWTLAGSPGENICTLKAGKSGDANEGAMVTITTSPQSFISALAGSATKKWEIKLETPTTHTDGAEKTSIITLAGTLD